jgi:hypothetical protein
MTGSTSKNLLDQTIDLYRAGKFSEAYEFITVNASKVEGQESQVFNFRYPLAIKAGKTALAMDILREAIKRGFGIPMIT